MLVWERALRRAHLPVRYSRGFNPKPHIAIAAPLPVGQMAAGDLLDLQLDRTVEPTAFLAALTPVLPPGLTLCDAHSVPLDAPALQEQLRAAEYMVTLIPDPGIRPELTRDEVAARVERLLAAEHLPRIRKRAGRLSPYDLRALVLALSIAEQAEPGEPNSITLQMRLQHIPGSTGRPEEVLAALDIADFGLGADEAEQSQDASTPDSEAPSGLLPDPGVIVRILRTRLLFDGE